MRLARRLLPVLAAALLAGPALAFPDRPITIINPYAPGSSTDAAARGLAEGFTRLLGQNVVVESRSGASGTIGMRAMAAAAPDGHTLAYSPMVPVAVQPHLVRGLDLRPDSVAMVCVVTENVLGIAVRADSPFRSPADLAAAARSRSLSFGSPGPNSAPFLGVHRMQQAAGGEYIHAAFRGDAASLAEVVAGRLDFAAIVAASAGPMARAGQVRLLGVFSERRHPHFPDAPTLREAGIDAVEPSYAGLFAPARTPEPVLNRLEEACRASVEGDTFRQIAERWSAVVSFMGRAEATRLLHSEYERQGRVLRELGVQPE